MRIIIVLSIILSTSGYSRFLPSAFDLDSWIVTQPSIRSSNRHTHIAQLGDIRGFLGPQGKSITVCQHGSDVAVIHGDPTSDPINNPMEICIAYSTDSGTTFSIYGPFSPEQKRIFPGTDGSPDFCTNPHQL